MHKQTNTLFARHKNIDSCHMYTVLETACMSVCTTTCDNRARGAAPGCAYEGVVDHVPFSLQRSHLILFSLQRSHSLPYSLQLSPAFSCAPRAGFVLVSVPFWIEP